MRPAAILRQKHLAGSQGTLQNPKSTRWTNLRVCPDHIEIDEAMIMTICQAAQHQEPLISPALPDRHFGEPTFLTSVKRTVFARPL